MHNVLVFPESKNLNQNIVFLAGPIHGAPLWQDEAIQKLQKINENIFIVSPRMREDKNLTEKEIIEKIDWETHYLNLAAEYGVLFFWLAKQIKNIPSNSYAQSTRFELSEWKERYRLSKFNLVVGIEPGFPGELYIKRRLNIDCPDLNIFSNLQDSCEEAARLILGAEEVKEK